MIGRSIRTVAAACGLLALGVVSAGAPRAAEPREGLATEPDAPGRAPRRSVAPLDLECTHIRRLSDNFALDLKIRFMFRPSGQSYVRLENVGRGWHLLDERPFESLTPAKIVLSETPALTSYVERLTGDYYHIDRTGTGLSVWGRCVPVSGLYRGF